jgi:hypothetical protein
MAYNRYHARQLCNAAEFELFEASMPGKIEKLADAELRSNIKRVRELRNKSQDLFQRQSLAIAETTGTKRGTSSKANKRTEQKVKLLGEVLERFEKARPSLD